MHLSNIAILALRGLDRETRKKLSDAIGVTEPTIYRYINENDDNLTKAAALEVIREITGLADDQILERDTEVVESKGEQK